MRTSDRRDTGHDETLAEYLERIGGTRATAKETQKALAHYTAEYANLIRGSDGSWIKTS